jgi:uncharacterized tellurite resistance protein B-like protein
VDPLAWLGLRSRKEAHNNLTAIHKMVRELLPDDEAFVLRYIVIVAILLTRVAHADGVFLDCELDRLRKFLEHIDRLPTTGIDELCATLNKHVPEMTASETDLCIRELKTLCDHDERVQIMRMLASQAMADGRIVGSEHGALVEIAEQLGIALTELEKLESEARDTDELPVPPDSRAPAHTNADSVSPKS